jgi:phosphoglycerate dehydrogenase-like enzyme
MNNTPEQKTLRVHFQRNLKEDALQMLISKLDKNIEFSAGEELPQDDRIQILIAGSIDEEKLPSLPNLERLVIPWAGIPTETREQFLGHPSIRIHNLHHNAAPTAETALALMFSAAKFIIPFDQPLRSGDWRPRYQENPVILLQEKTALILGYGQIGQYVGRVCRALNMEVLALRRNVAPGEHLHEGVKVYPQSELHTLLPRVQVLIVTLPLTDETRGMIAEAELKLMKKGGILVNVGRGPVVDQGALYRALRDGTLAAAGLDVWYNYPKDKESRANTPPADFPFGELDNVVMSPHRGGEGGTRDVEKLRMSALAQLLNSAARGETVPNQVDLTAGY